MALKLESKLRNKDVKSREELVAEDLLAGIFSHNLDTGATSSLTLGLPSSCKTTINLVMAQNAMNFYPKDKVFWRSVLGAPLQFLKIKPYQIFVQRDSGINFFNRVNGENITKEMDIKYFSTFDELYDNAQGGVCNAPFFRDSHLAAIGPDKGVVLWLDFIHWILEKYEWKHIFLDEMWEMCRADVRGEMWRRVNTFSEDISNARKANLSIHGNAHQLSEMLWKVNQAIMCTIQCWGSRPSSTTPISKRALGCIRKPTEEEGATAWISSAGAFGKLNVSEILKLPPGVSIQAKILPEQELTCKCEVCEKTILKENAFCGDYCSKGCYYARYGKKKGAPQSPQPAPE